MKRRVGRFRITHNLMTDDWRTLLPFFAQVVVVRAESHYLGWIDYTGFSDLFEEIDEGVEAPEYIINVEKRDDGSLSFNAVRR